MTQVMQGHTSYSVDTRRISLASSEASAPAPTEPKSEPYEPDTHQPILSQPQHQQNTSHQQSQQSFNLQPMPYEPRLVEI